MSKEVKIIGVRTNDADLPKTKKLLSEARQKTISLTRILGTLAATATAEGEPGIGRSFTPIFKKVQKIDQELKSIYNKA